MTEGQGATWDVDENKEEAVRKLCDAKAFILITVDETEDGNTKSCYAGGTADAFEIVGAMEVFKQRVIEDFTEGEDED